jgi:hydrogenase nickel incorporation protein HypB
MTDVDVRQRILAANEAAAAEVRARFDQAGTLVVNLISSPGAGKTTLLEHTVARLADRLRIAAIEGDIATERDAERLRRRGIRAQQIQTGGACHLDARQIRRALEQARFPELDLLFIENVGNLICPTAYDLGEDLKVVLLSVAEGDDKPFKYPGIFSRAAVAVITKIDLLPHVPFQLHSVRAEIAALNPHGLILETSVVSGSGLGDWCRLIESRLAAKRVAAA